MKNLYLLFLLTFCLCYNANELAAQFSGKVGTAELGYTSATNPNYLAAYGISGLKIRSNDFRSNMDAFALSYTGSGQSSTLSANSVYLSQSLTGYAHAVSLNARRLIYSGSQPSQVNNETWYFGPTDIGAYDPNDPVTSLFSLSSERTKGGDPTLRHHYFSADPISGSLSIGTEEVYADSRMYVSETGEKEAALRVRHQSPTETFGAYGIYSSSVGANPATGRYGIFAFAGGSSQANYGVFGSTDATASHYGVYANGNLAYTATLTNVSDRKFKRNISAFRALDRIMKLAPRTYEMKRDKYKRMNLAEGRQFGFIAQELQEVFPELVHESLNAVPYEEEDGSITTEKIDYLGVDYISMVPILTQAMQEQQTIIEAKEERIRELEDRLDRLEAIVREITGQAAGDDQQDTGTIPAGSLLQNQPNPFQNSTIIPYFIPEQVQKAQLQLTDASGRIIQTFDVNGRGEGRFTLTGDQLSHGVYYYTLLLDGRLVATRKMIAIE
ncbi:MAG: tail fiber domain-containing protein [Saprospiraceae bacterium]|nr:tail fiber domain-containing protein [Lewinella sp.]